MIYLPTSGDELTIGIHLGNLEKPQQNSFNLCAVMIFYRKSAKNLSTVTIEPSRWQVIYH